MIIILNNIIDYRVCYYLHICTCDICDKFLYLCEKEIKLSYINYVCIFHLSERIEAIDKRQFLKETRRMYNLYYFSFRLAGKWNNLT